MPALQGRTPDLTTTWRENGFVPKPNLPVYFHIWKYRRTPGTLENKAIPGNLSARMFMIRRSNRALEWTGSEYDSGETFLAPRGRKPNDSVNEGTLNARRNTDNAR